MKSIFLSGFMGCGKSTVGAIISEKLAVPFIDADEYIVDMCGKSIPDIFTQDGGEKFRELESICANELLEKSNIIVATGGGMMISPHNWGLIKNLGLVVYINIGFEACYNRIIDSDRPLVNSRTREQLEDLYTYRNNIYTNHCHISINNINTSEKIADAIISHIHQSI